ncbi:hypothetical protein HII31_13026 [Pseudocercospora fuligena]|uniref:Uncharacterized protein n=1 Tax=Pseudocercospora fuligena TaxID=685502 RepID=A0A8H6R8W1_9PEZI|nr:hypothetical protein HII31_13026 [Pseudocercospora fuligena]
MAPNKRLPYDYKAIDRSLAANENLIFTPESFNELYTAALATQEATEDSKEQYRRHNLLYGLLERRKDEKLKLKLALDDDEDEVPSRSEFLNLAVAAFLESGSESGSDNDTTMLNVEAQSQASAGSVEGIGADDAGTGGEAGESAQEWGKAASVGSLEAAASNLNSDYKSLVTWRDNLQAHADWLHRTEAELREKDQTMQAKWQEAEKTKTDVMERERNICKEEKEVARREEDVARKEKDLERRAKDMVIREMDVQKKELAARGSSLSTDRALKQAEKEKKDLQDQIVSINERLEREKQKNHNFNNDELAKLTSDIGIADAGNELRDTGIAKLKTKIRELEEEKSNTKRLHQHEITKLKTAIGDQKRHVAVLHQEKVSLEGAIAAKEAHIAHLQHELDDEKNTSNKNNLDLWEVGKLKDEEIAELKMQISSLEGTEAQVSALEKEVSQLQCQLGMEKSINNHQTLTLIPKLRGEIAELKEDILRKSQEAGRMPSLPDSFIPDHVAARVQFLHSSDATRADRQQFKAEMAGLWASKHGDRDIGAAGVGVKLDSIKAKLREGLVIPSARELRDVVEMVNEVLVEVKPSDGFAAAEYF